MAKRTSTGRSTNAYEKQPPREEKGLKNCSVHSEKNLLNTA